MTPPLSPHGTQNKAPADALRRGFFHALLPNAPGPTAQTGRGRSMASQWSAHKASSQAGGRLQGEKCALQWGARPDGRQRPGGRQEERRQRIQGIEGGLQAWHTPQALGRTPPEYAAQRPMPMRLAVYGITPHSNRSVACGHPTPTLHRHGPHTGENRRHKKTRQANLAG